MVEGSTDRVSYTCTGGKGPYAIPSDMSVSLTARGNATNLKVILVDADDNETELTLTTEYTVTGRNVYTVSNYSSSYTLIIARSMPFTQTRDLRNNSTLNMEHLEDAFDAACLERRELSEQIGRQLVFPISDPDGLDYELPSVGNRASSFIACDASGNVIAAAGVSSVPVSTYIEDVLDDTTTPAVLSTLGIAPDDVLKLLNEENYTILDDDGYKQILVTTGAASSGTATTDTEDKLIDSGATFQTDGVAAGDTIWNKTDDTFATVVSVDSETQLTLDDDVFPDGDEDWEWLPVTIALPTAADNTGRVIRIKKLDSGTGKVYLTYETGEDEANLRFIEYQRGYAELISNGTDWYLLAHQDSNIVLKQKIAEIGAWDMDTDETKTVDIGISIDNLICVIPVIKWDSAGYDNKRRQLFLDPTDQTEMISIQCLPAAGSTHVQLARRPTGYFDSVNFDEAGTFNRGWLVIWYTDSAHGM